MIQTCSQINKIFSLAVILLSVILTISSCSSGFIYNQLDWLILRYLDDYVDLNRRQQQQLKIDLPELLRWHRREELNEYDQFLSSIQNDLKQPLSVALVEQRLVQGEDAYQRIKAQLSPLLMGLVSSLTEKQVDEFARNLAKQQQKLEKKYLQRNDKKFHSDSYKSFLGNTEGWMGKLNEAQRKQLWEATQKIKRIDEPWLQQRQLMVSNIVNTLREKDPGWLQKLEAYSLPGNQLGSKDYQLKMAHNKLLITKTLVDIINYRDESQDRHLQRELQRWKKRLGALQK